MVLTMADDIHRQPTSRPARYVRRESDARRDLERMHLMTIRREKMRLQQELERVRVKKKSNFSTTNNATLLSNRFGMTSLDSSLTSGSGEDTRRWLMLSAVNGGPPVMSPNGCARRTRTAGPVGSSDHELPIIGYMHPSPIKGELDLRRQKDELKDPNTMLNELKKNEGRQKDLLSLKVDRFTRSLSPISSRRSPVPSTSPKPIEEADGSGSDLDSQMKRNDSDLDTRASFPPTSRKKATRESIADCDVDDAKNAISRRLATTADVEEGQNPANLSYGSSRQDDVLPRISPNTAPQPPTPARRPTVIRRESQVAILDRSDGKKNKYATNNNIDNEPMQGASRKTTERDTDVSLSTLGREAKRVREIIENPDMVFDQEKYAPDGALRTVHMLPDPDIAFSHARKARYLRWRDPNETNYERELSITDIFSKGK